jgi:pseudooxynicotine oxidase
VWTEITRYGLAIDETAAATAEKAIWFDDNTRVAGSADTYSELFERAAEAFYEPARKAFPRPFDPLYSKDLAHLDTISPVEVIEGLQLSQVEKNLALSLAGINAHAPPEQSSYLDQLRWFALGNFNVWNMWDNLGRYRVKGGMNKLLQRMRQDSNARFLMDSPVKSIVSDEGKVVVTTNAGKTYHARAVVVAVPLNCLADIDFQPSLGAVKARVSKARHTGSGTKIYARVKNVKFPVMCQGTVGMPLNFLWTEYVDSGSQILVGFGTNDKLLNLNSEAAVQSAVRDFLPEAELLEFFTYDWNADPYSKGTWCMYRPNTLTEDFQELHVNQGNVYFSGADIAHGWRGFIDGAIESGLRVGHEVADGLKKG